MLKREEANAELEKLRNKQWMKSRLGAVDGLPEPLRETTRSLLSLDDDSLSGVSQVRRRKEIGNAVHSMDDAARLKFFETLKPGMGSIIERAWHLFDRLPYQTGFDRKPFRAPNDPGTLRYRRMIWLAHLIPCIGPYDKPITWFAAWAPHFNYFEAEQLGILFAAAIDAGGAEGEEVFQILCASGRNEHEIGGMGRHVIRGLISASKPEGWQFIENMLLAAQREEGLRQTILESIDEGHPEIFRRMLRLIIDKKLARFSATVRAFDTWLGYQWDAVSVGVVNDTIEKLLLFLGDAAAREAAFGSKDGEEVYLALWSHAFDDAIGALRLTTEMLKHPKVEHRFAAIHLQNQLGLVESQTASVQAMVDSDLRVATCALLYVARRAVEQTKKMDLFERIEKLVERYPQKPEKLKPVIWPWITYTVSKELAANLLANNLGERSPTRLIPHLQHMGTQNRAQATRLLGKQPKWSDATRDTLFALIGDASSQVRDAVLDCLKQCQITSEEAGGIEKLLDRKSGDLRRGALTILGQQSDQCALASADRLLASSSQPQRLAGLELVRQLGESKRCVGEARHRAEKYRDAHPKLNEADRVQIDAVLNLGREAPTLDNGLGLFDHDKRTWSPQPTAHKVQFHSPAAAKVIAGLQEWMHSKSQEVVSVVGTNGEEWKGLFGEWRCGFSRLNPNISAEEHRKSIPLADDLEKWWLSRGKEMIDGDGLEILRAFALMEFRANYRRSDLRSALPKAEAQLTNEAVKLIFGDTLPPKNDGEEPLRYMGHYGVLNNFLTWLLRLHQPTGAVQFALEACESALALVPKSMLRFTSEEAAELKQPEKLSLTTADWNKSRALQQKLENKTIWREPETPYGAWWELVQHLSSYAPELWTPQLRARYWRLSRWVDQPIRPRESGGDSDVSEFCCVARERAGLRDRHQFFTRRGH